MARDSELPDALDVSSVLPGYDDPFGTPKLLPTALSPELEQLLSSAEHRVLAGVMPSGPPSPEDEVDLILSPELLASLDEPLEPDEFEEGTGSGLIGTPAPAAAGTARGKTPAVSHVPLTTHAGTQPGAAPGTHVPAAESGEAGASTHHGPQTATGDEARDPARPRDAGEREEPPDGRVEPPSEESTGVGQAPASSSVSTEDTGEAPADAGGGPQATETPDDASSRMAPDSLSPLFGLSWQPSHGEPVIAARAEGASASVPTTEPSPFASTLLPGAVPPRRPGGLSFGPAAGLPTTPPAVASHPPLGGDGGAPALEMNTYRAPTLARHIDAGSVLPAVLAEGEAVHALAQAIAERISGSVAIASADGLRRIVLHDGDLVTAASGVADETLVAFLALRGDMDRDTAARLSGKLPPSGRHAGAALIAYGHLGQDDLWPVLRAHAEFILGRAILGGAGTCDLETEPPGRLRAEPSVFGGATGAEVLVEIVRRVISPDLALARLGGRSARIEQGARLPLLGECALRAEEDELMRSSRGRTVEELIQAAHGLAPEIELAPLLYALGCLDVIRALAPAATRAGASTPDPLDEEALRSRVRARLALVEDGDYFAVLGVSRAATSYEVKRAYLAMRRAYEPARVLTAATADLAEPLRTVVEVLDEAYEVLREPHRRERYRRAIEAGPPA
ncbi:MAG: DnaJ domain-containing protein [Polyangiaceae bacterium]